MGGARSTYKRKEQFIEELHREPAGRPFGKRKCSCEDDIKMDLKDARWYGVHCTELAECRDR